MSVYLGSRSNVQNFLALRRGLPTDFSERDSNCLEIGLVNNMPNTALEATERQFRARLESAGEGILIRLRFYTLPGISRSYSAQEHLDSYYSEIDELWNNRLDGLIVTGAEPRKPDLKDEPYWSPLTALIDWAGDHTDSAIWSCLAAHATVLYMDGINRQSLTEKRSGVFECQKASDHVLTKTLAQTVYMPHSRWNELSESALKQCGYQTLTRSEIAGADGFVKDKNSLFVFFQGHPEYDTETLLFEYRRDVGRFFKGEADRYPTIPEGYFDQDTRATLNKLRERAFSDRRKELLKEIHAVLGGAKLRNSWRSSAIGIYRNWLLYLSERKAQRLRQQRRSQFNSKRNVRVA